LLQCAVRLIPESLNYPEKTNARIIYDNFVFSSSGKNTESGIRLISLEIDDNPRNRLEIYRNQTNSGRAKEKLTDTEQKHLKIITRLIGRLGENAIITSALSKMEVIAAGPVQTEENFFLNDDTFTESNRLNEDCIALNFPENYTAENSNPDAIKLRDELRKRALIENKLRQERRRLYSVLDKIPASIHLVSSDHKIKFANRMFMDQFGDCLTKSCHEILYSSSQPCAECKTFRVFEKKDLGVHESVRSNGRMYRIYNYPFIDSDGTELILQLAVDITERKKAENELRKSEQRFRSLVSSVDDTVFTLDKEFKFVEIYGSLFERLGHRYSHCLDKPFCKVFKSGNTSIHKDALNKALSGETVLYEWTTLHADKLHYIQSSVSPLYDEKGQAEGIVGIARDITKLRTLENQSIQTEKLMAVGELSAMISHEFRNALTSVKMILELQLESENLDESEHQSMKVALNSISHMEDIVRNLLNFTKPQPIILEQDSVITVIEESLKLISGQLKKHNIRLRKNLTENLPSLPMDKVHLQEAIVNILINAVNVLKDEEPSPKNREIIINCRKRTLKTDLIDRYGSDSGLKKIKLSEHINYMIRKGKECIVIEIRDNGFGIKKEYLNRIFDPFFTTNLTGTGLGLAVVRRTIQAHHGIIRVESKNASGTVFKIYLPI
jgi:PAS domain S-box-containing protein